MRKGIHPEIYDTEIHCGCGHTYTGRSALKSIRIETCSKCHPFFTGTEKLLDVAGRVDKFQKRFNWDATRDQIKI